MENRQEYIAGERNEGLRPCLYSPVVLRLVQLRERNARSDPERTSPRCPLVLALKDSLEWVDGLANSLVGPSAGTFEREKIPLLVRHLSTWTNAPLGDRREKDRRKSCCVRWG